MIAQHYSTIADGLQEFADSVDLLGRDLDHGYAELRGDGSVALLRDLNQQLRTQQAGLDEERESFMPEGLDQRLPELSDVLDNALTDLFPKFECEAHAALDGLAFRVGEVRTSLAGDSGRLAREYGPLAAATRDIEVALSQAVEAADAAVADLDASLLALHGALEQVQAEVMGAITALTQDVGDTHTQSVATAMDSFRSLVSEQKPTELTSAYQWLSGDLEKTYNLFRTEGAALADRMAADVTAVLGRAEDRISAMVPDVSQIVGHVVGETIKEMAIEVGLNIALMNMGAAFTTAMHGFLYELILAKKALEIINALFGENAGLVTEVNKLLDQIGIVGDVLKLVANPLGIVGSIGNLLGFG